LEFIEDVVPHLPAHLRLELIRYTAIHDPLSDDKLYALLGPECHADGELLIVGSFASLSVRQAKTIVAASSREYKPARDWDVEDGTPHHLQSLIVMSTSLTMSTVLTLPPTITHMALINLENPISPHRLPGLCPLLIALDLSYNSWLTHMSVDTLKSIERIDWNRWTQLRILGWRNGSVPDGMLTRLNKGRWDDVEVVLE